MPKGNSDNIFSVKKMHTNSPDEAEVNESLDSIYRDEGGSSMNISSLEKSSGRGFLYYVNWIIGLGLLSFGLFWAYTYIAERFFAPEEGSLSVMLEMPGSVASGEEFSFDIVYTNDLNVRVREVEIQLQKPDTFVFKEAMPSASDADNRYWKIASIAAGKTERITITGSAFGEVGSNHIFQVFMSYEPENFSSRFETQTSAVLQVAAGNIITKKTFPAQAVAGETLTYEVELFAADDFDSNTIVRITPVLPDSFEILAEESTELVENAAYWEVSGLRKEEETPEGTAPKVTLKGQFLDSSSLEETIVFEYTIKGPDENYYLERKDDFVTKLIEGEFILNLILNGESEEKAVNVGESLTYSLTYRNQSKTDAKDVVISMEFPAGYLNYETLSATPSGVRNGDSISWSSDQIKGLAELPSGEGGSIDLVVSMKDVLPSGSAPEFSNLAKATISGFGDLDTELTVRSNEIAALINSDLSWYASARYYNDDDIAIGTGPMPPQVGRTTTLHIIWRVESSSHEITSLKVVGKLPSIVDWTGKATAESGSITYNESSRTVTWNVDKLAKGKGVVEADFEISITPTFDDLNKIILLMQNAKLTALDKDTNGEIAISGKSLTTDLEDDPVLSGRGLVEN